MSLTAAHLPITADHRPRTGYTVESRGDRSNIRYTYRSLRRHFARNHARSIIVSTMSMGHWAKLEATR